MAKTPTSPTAAALAAVLPPDVKVVQVPQNASVAIDVDVNEMVIPYTVAVDGAVVIKSLVDRRESLALTAGTHRLGWAFAHVAKGWMHKLTLRIGNTTTVIESKSEAKKDQDHSVGVVFLVVA